MQLHITVADLIAVFGIVVAGSLGWRWKRGDFYKSVAVEKTDQANTLQAELDMRRRMTDITPIVAALETVSKTLETVTKGLERHAQVTEEVFKKVAEMNGSLRATTTAMQALGDRLIVDEAARGLLATAGDPTRHSER